MTLYAIKDLSSGKSLLVEAPRPESALRRVTDAIYAISTPSPLEAALLVVGGASVLEEGETIPPLGTVIILELSEDDALVGITHGEEDADGNTLVIDPSVLGKQSDDDAPRVNLEERSQKAAEERSI